jgi:DNA uptake protein ComE-like DNA-binding protein
MTAPPPAPFRVNVNAAGKEELMTLPGIGEVEARRIASGRPYANIADLARKAGLSPAAIRRIQPRVAFVDAPERSQAGPAPVMHPVAPQGASARPPRPAPLPYADKADLNSASREELVSKAHLDPMTAMRVIKGRPYARLAELKKIGFTPEKIRDLSHFVKIGSPPKL